ncbi:hypothetical protein BJY21_001997 [Kineosphaera limosa]|uniref:HEPN domain-containing protein n=1 Tax=Kineosphaera limosa NBRC 100340 TaxID=1184609 RepID=K6WB21_9MICO|nr:hypothetical protein [Kineosphaera limosa]NYE00813.1 hypothetical protein [Kineosphaera limosa]GAB96425.1 hypothetical protein KILIM_038_00140 [Kineosphaera limosa NBRC 100340]
MRTRSGDKGDARQRLDLGDAYLDLADLANTASSRAARQAAVGNYVLAAIAYADVICLAALGRRSAETDHTRAAQLLATTDPSAADSLRKLLSYKTQAHYGTATMSPDDLKRAQRLTQTLRRAANMAVASSRSS